MHTSPRDKSEAESALWPLTDWSRLERAAKAVGTDSDDLNRLLQRYQRPLRVFLDARFPNLKQEAEDLLQEFTRDKFLREGWLGKAQRGPWRFRNFLKASLKHFVLQRLRRRCSLDTPLDELAEEPAAEALGAEAFDLEWARIVIAQVLARMETDCLRVVRGQPDRFKIWEVFRLRILEPILNQVEPIAYDELVSKLGLRSSIEAQNLKATGKRMFERQLSAVISEYENGERAVKAEIQSIKEFVDNLAKGRRHKSP